MHSINKSKSKGKGKGNRGLSLLLLYSFLHSFLLVVEGATFQLDQSAAAITCFVSSPCSFADGGIWVGGDAPINGSDIFRLDKDKEKDTDKD